MKFCGGLKSTQPIVNQINSKACASIPTTHPSIEYLAASLIFGPEKKVLNIDIFISWERMGAILGTDQKTFLLKHQYSSEFLDNFRTFVIGEFPKAL